MNKMLIGLVALASIGIMPVHADIAFEVKDVEAHPRYPWNGKVDIDFTIDSAAEGSNFAVRVSAVDTIGQTNVTLNTVRYNDLVDLASIGKLPAGRHRVTWDADVDVPNAVLPSIAFSVSTWVGDAASQDSELYMVVDLSGDTVTGKYRVSYLPSVPTGGWRDEYKTTKLVLRKIPGENYYAGIFEVTWKQAALIVKSDTLLHPYTSPLTLSGVMPAAWTNEYSSSCTFENSDPLTLAVECASRLNSNREDKSLTFAIPLYSEWLKVRDAGARNAYDRLLQLGVAGWTIEDANKMVHEVGEKQPNAWGIYDMCGNVSEVVCVDHRSRRTYHYYGGNCFLTKMSAVSRRCNGGEDDGNTCYVGSNGPVGVRIFCYRNN